MYFLTNTCTLTRAFCGLFKKTSLQENSSLTKITQNSSKKLKVSPNSFGRVANNRSKLESCIKDQKRIADSILTDLGTSGKVNRTNCIIPQIEYFRCLVGAWVTTLWPCTPPTWTRSRLVLRAVHLKTLPNSCDLSPSCSPTSSWASSPPARSVQVWSLTQFYFVDFSKSRIDVK